MLGTNDKMLRFEPTKNNTSYYYYFVCKKKTYILSNIPLSRDCVRYHFLIKIVAMKNNS